MATAFDTMRTEAKTAFEKFDWKGVGKNLTNAIRDGINEAKSNVLTAMGTVIDETAKKITDHDWKKNGTDLATDLKNGINDKASDVTGAMGTIVTDTAKKITEHTWKTDGENLATAIKDGIKGKSDDIKNQMSSAASDAKSQFTGIDWKGVGDDICCGIRDGINNNKWKIKDALKTAAEEAVKAAKDALDINSPSRVMRDEVGRWIPEGIAEGIRKNADIVGKSMVDVRDQLTADTLEAALMAEGNRLDISGGNAAANGRGDFVQNNNYYSPKALSPYEAARQTRIATQGLVLQLQGV